MVTAIRICVLILAGLQVIEAGPKKGKKGRTFL